METFGSRTIYKQTTRGVIGKMISLKELEEVHPEKIDVFMRE
jgi:hypothetical protein